MAEAEGHELPAREKSVPLQILQQAAGAKLAEPQPDRSAKDRHDELVATLSVRIVVRRNEAKVVRRASGGPGLLQRLGDAERVPRPVGLAEIWMQRVGSQRLLLRFGNRL